MGGKGPSLGGSGILGDIIRPGVPRRRRHRKALRGISRAALYLFALVFVMGLLAAGLVTFARLKFKAGAEHLSSLTRPGKGTTVLVVGSDLSKVLPGDGQGRRGLGADTVSLVHYDSGGGRTILITMPAQLRIAGPDGREGTLGDFYRRGADNLVKAVQGFSGIPLNHFLEVDWNKFGQTVDALGGIEVSFDQAIDDPGSRLRVPAGCVSLSRSKVLALVRSRSIGDELGRIRRQGIIFQALVAKVRSAGTFINPIRLVRVTDLFAGTLVGDDHLSVKDARSLSDHLGGYLVENLDVRMVPNATTRIGTTTVALANEHQSAALFRALREGRPLPQYGLSGVSAIDPADVKVSVLNGTDTKGVAAKGAAALRGKGFEVVNTDNADRSDYLKTTAFFDAGQQEKAKLVAAAFGADVQPLPSTIVSIGDVAVVLGSDFAAGKTSASTPSQAPPPPPANPPLHPCGR